MKKTEVSYIEIKLFGSLLLLCLIAFPGWITMQISSYLTCGICEKAYYIQIGVHYLIAMVYMLFGMLILIQKRLAKYKWLVYFLPASVFLLIYFLLSRKGTASTPLFLIIFFVFSCLVGWCHKNAIWFRKEWTILKMHAIRYGLLYLILAVILAALLEYIGFTPLDIYNQCTELP